MLRAKGLLTRSSGCSFIFAIVVMHTRDGDNRMTCRGTYKGIKGIVFSCGGW